MPNTDLTKLPPLQPGLDMEDCWFCYEFRSHNEDFISPWFDDPHDIFEYLEELDDFLITRRYIRSSDGIFEDDGVENYYPLPPVDITWARTTAGHKSLEDQILG